MYFGPRTFFIKGAVYTIYWANIYTRSVTSTNTWFYYNVRHFTFLLFYSFKT